MSILDLRTLEDELYDADTATVRELLGALDEGRAPNPRFWMCFLRLSTALRDATDPADITGSRQRFQKWFADETDGMVIPLNDFFQRYIVACRDMRRTEPFAFTSGQEESHFKTALTHILEAIRSHREGFAFWPPGPQ